MTESTSPSTPVRPVTYSSSPRQPGNPSLRSRSSQVSDRNPALTTFSGKQTTKPPDRISTFCKTPDHPSVHASSQTRKRLHDESAAESSSPTSPKLQRKRKSPAGKIHHIATVACSGTDKCSEPAKRYRPLVQERTVPIVTVTLGPVQEMHEIGTGAAFTVVHQDAWHKYVNYCRRQGRDVSDWDQFWQLPHNLRQDHSIWISRHQANDVLAVGPFRAEFLIDGAHVLTHAFITKEDIDGNFLLGDDLWKPQSEVAAVEGETDLLSDCEITLSVRKKNFNALLDSGASVSLLSKAKYEDLGFELKDLYTSSTMLTAANGGRLKIVGKTADIHFTLKDFQCKHEFLVIEDLNCDAILGRDFFRRHDVLLDLPRGKAIFRNCTQNYFIHSYDKFDSQVRSIVAKPVNLKSPHFSKAEVKLVTFEIQDQVGSHGTNWLGPRDQLHLEPAGKDPLKIARAIAPVIGRRFELPVFNTSLEHASDLPESIVINAQKVHTAYERIPVNQEHNCQHVNEDEDDNLSDNQYHDFKFGQDRELLLSEEDERQPTKIFPTRPTYDPVEAGMSPDQIRTLEHIFDEYEDIFSRSPSDIGLTHLAEHPIIIDKNIEPPRTTPRRMTPAKRESARRQVQELLDKGFIQTSESPFASGIVMVEKPNGEYRMAVDYRRLNAITKKDAFPLPRIDQTLGDLGNARYFTTLDMGSAFWQIKVDKSSVERTAFVTHEGLYEWLRMPFGLCNAPARFQRMMRQALAPILNAYGNLVLCYIDDILIATQTIDEHLIRLCEVFNCLRNAGLKLKAEKCKVLKTQTKFLGRQISEGRLSPDPDKIAPVRSWQRPQTQKDLSRFLGFASYYREFIRDFATIAEPLSRLQRKNTKILEWGEAQENAFELLKEKLCTAPVLGLPNETGKFYLDTDASEVAVGGVLQQKQMINGQEKLVVIAYHSRKLHDYQMNYGAPKKEMLAVVECCQKWRCFLVGAEFVLRVDNQALCWLKTYSWERSGTIARWIQLLQDYPFEVVHRARTQHRNADGLTKLTQYYLENEESEQQPMRCFPFMRQDQYDALETFQSDDIRPEFCKTGKRKSEEAPPTAHVVKPPKTGQRVRFTLPEATTEDDLLSPVFPGPLAWTTPSHSVETFHQTQCSTNSTDAAFETGQYAPEPVYYPPESLCYSSAPAYDQSQVWEGSSSKGCANSDYACPVPTPVSGVKPIYVCARKDMADALEKGLYYNPQEYYKGRVDFSTDPPTLRRKSEKLAEASPDVDLIDFDTPCPPPQTLEVAEARALTPVSTEVCAIQILSKYDPLEIANAQSNDCCLRLLYKIACDPLHDFAEELKLLPSTEQQFIRRNYRDVQLNNHGILMLRHLEGPIWLVPERYRYEVLHHLHNRLGHLGQKRVIKIAVKKFEWPGMRGEIEKFIASCPQCQVFKGNRPTMRFELQSFEVSRPNQVVQIDFEQLPLTSSGYRYVLTIIDHYTKYAEAYKLRSITAKKAANAIFKNWICRYGPMEVLHSDQGSQFESALFAYWAKRLEIGRTRTSPEHPQANGLCERMNQTIKNMLCTNVQEHGEEWDRYLETVLFAYNATCQESTGFSPNLLWFGREVQLPLSLIFPDATEKPPPNSYDEHVEKLRSSISNNLAIARENTRQATKRQRRNYDKRVHGKPLEIGTQVLLHTLQIQPGVMRKMAPKFKGPFRVLEVLNGGRDYLLDLGKRGQKIFHFDRLKAYHGRPAELVLGDSSLGESWDDETIDPDIVVDHRSNARLGYETDPNLRARELSRQRLHDAVNREIEAGRAEWSPGGEHLYCHPALDSPDTAAQATSEASTGSDPYDADDDEVITDSEYPRTPPIVISAPDLTQEDAQDLPPAVTTNRGRGTSFPELDNNPTWTSQEETSSPPPRSPMFPRASIRTPSQKRPVPIPYSPKLVKFWDSDPVSTDSTLPYTQPNAVETPQLTLPPTNQPIPSSTSPGFSTDSTLPYGSPRPSDLTSTPTLPPQLSPVSPDYQLDDFFRTRPISPRLNPPDPPDPKPPDPLVSLPRNLPVLRRSTRIRQPPKRLRDFVRLVKPASAKLPRTSRVGKGLTSPMCVRCLGLLNFPSGSFRCAACRLLPTHLTQISIPPAFIK